MLKERLKHLINTYSSVDQKGKIIALKNQIALLKKGHESIDLAEQIIVENDSILSELDGDLANGHRKLSEQIKVLEQFKEEISTKQELILSNEDRARQNRREIDNTELDTAVFKKKLEDINLELEVQFEKIESLEQSVQESGEKKQIIQSEYESTHHHFVKCKSTIYEQEEIIERNCYLTDQLISEIDTFKIQIEKSKKELSTNEVKISEQGRELALNQTVLQEIVNELNIYQHRLKRLHNRIGSNRDKLKEQKKTIDYNTKEIEQVRSVLKETKHSLEIQNINIRENDGKIWSQRKWLDDNTRLAHDRKHDIQKNKEILNDQERLIENNLKRIHIAKAQLQEEEVTLNIQQITIDNNKKEIQSVKDELHQQESMLSSLRQQQKENEISIIRMGTLHHTLDKARKNRYLSIDSSKEVLKKTLLKVEEQEKVLNEKKSELSQKTGELKRLESEVEAYAARIRDQKRKLEVLERDLNDQKELLGEYEQKLGQLKKRDRGQAGRIKSHEHEIQENVIKLSSIKSEIEELTLLQQKYELRVANGYRLHAEQEQQIIDLSAEYSILKEEVNSLGKEIDDLESSNSYKQNQLVSLQHKVESEQKEKSVLEDKIASLKAESLSIDSSLKAQNLDYATSKESLLSKEKELEKLGLYISESRALIDEQKDVILRYSEEVKEKDHKILDLRAELEKVEAEAQMSSDDLLKLYSQIADADQEINGLKESLNIKESKLNDIRSLKTLLYKHLDEQDRSLLDMYKKVEATNLIIEEQVENVIKFPVVSKSQKVQVTFSGHFDSVVTKEEADFITVTCSKLNCDRTELMVTLKGLMSKTGYKTVGGIQLAKNKSNKISAFRINLLSDSIETPFAVESAA